MFLTLICRPGKIITLQHSWPEKRDIYRKKHGRQELNKRKNLMFLTPENIFTVRHRTSRKNDNDQQSGQRQIIKKYIPLALQFQSDQLSLLHHALSDVGLQSCRPRTTVRLTEGRKASVLTSAVNALPRSDSAPRSKILNSKRADHCLSTGETHAQVPPSHGPPLLASPLIGARDLLPVVFVMAFCSSGT